MTPQSPDGCAILSLRRSGASGVYRLLVDFVPLQPLGTHVFRWDRALGEISREFHEGSRADAQAQLAVRLATPSLLHHCVDSESFEFNEMLRKALSARGYRIVRVHRDAVADRIYSKCIAQWWHAGDPAAIAALREALRSGAVQPEIDFARLKRMLLEDAAFRRWMDDALPAGAEGTTCVRYESLFRSGVAGLAAWDELLARVGGAPRAARIGEAEALKRLLTGDHHAGSLRQHARAFDTLHAAIATEIERETVRKSELPTT